MSDPLRPPRSSDSAPLRGYSGDPGNSARVRSAPSGWAVFGIVLAVVFALAGLALVGVLVLVFVGLNNYGSNK
ncbi:hypothetical protein [Peterkaempfera griseoplana]|uniref:hypothetical protein n=1 Tax=Peterkaempfera griseoplana TaxID=66896 RepID=UPI000A8A5AE1|nr:hypothetical protein [Peterkaempfera griseoplana]